MKSQVLQSVLKIDRKQLRNNTQKAAYALLRAAVSGNPWVPRTKLRIPSAPARIRDLRKVEYGRFDVECVPANFMEVTRGRKVTSKATSNQTYYRLFLDDNIEKSLKRLFGDILS